MNKSPEPDRWIWGDMQGPIHIRPLIPVKDLSWFELQPHVFAEDEMLMFDVEPLVVLIHPLRYQRLFP